MKTQTLEGAVLFETNLEGANLGNINMKGADIRTANLKNIIWGNKVGEHTFNAVLPDGTLWTEKTIMQRFTDNNHREYESTLAKINVIREDMELDPLR